MNESYVSKKVRKYLEEADVLWLYSGEPNANVPHAVLTSGKHSNGYVNVGKMLKKFPEVRRELANIIVRSLRRKWTGKVDRVVGADTSSTALAKDVAIIAKAGHITMKKVSEPGRKLPRQIWNYNENTPLRDGEVIFHVEDLITTSSSAMEVRKGIRHANCGVKVMFAPLLVAIVERSDPDKRVTQVEDSIILPLLQLSIQNYDPETCPYCVVGSKAIADVKKNWDELVATSAPSVELGGVRWR